MMPASQLSRMVVGKALRCVPYPLLGENTLVLSDSLTLAPDDDGNLALMFRWPPPCSLFCHVSLHLIGPWGWTDVSFSILFFRLRKGPLLLTRPVCPSRHRLSGPALCRYIPSPIPFSPTSETFTTI